MYIKRTCNLDFPECSTQKPMNESIACNENHSFPSTSSVVNVAATSECKRPYQIPILSEIPKQVLLKHLMQSKSQMPSPTGKAIAMPPITEANIAPCINALHINSLCIFRRSGS